MADPEGNGRRRTLTAKELARVAKESVSELTGFPAESVSALQWDGETWLVTVGVCELERIPSTTDVLAEYVVQLDESGGLLGFRRERRFHRGATEEE